MAMTTTELTQEEKRIKIAEACGWVQTSLSPKGIPMGQKPTGKGGHYGDCKFPDYFNDLNAMHEAVASLHPKKERHAYAIVLAGMLWPIEGWRSWHDTLAVSEATAAQRAEAFGIALGLWP